MVYKRALEMSGLVVSAFEDPLFALDEFKANYSKYDLIITDIRMPNMDGFMLTNQIKKINPNVKVIFVTAQQISKSDIVANLDKEVSIDEFIIKPVSLDVLNRTVHSVIKNTWFKIFLKSISFEFFVWDFTNQIFPICSD